MQTLVCGFLKPAACAHVCGNLQGYWQGGDILNISFTFTSLAARPETAKAHRG
eukprot:TRINITY_DN15063_c0_g1_i1.p1 TRINITY_DN15063_c0_g1~~TRINITY_DN15063_c0_g1_i1.p1  ORF type:complete len:53 (+),score=7.55 TRINITY_DN15063_c0_g1_i1:232-390(+)